MEGETFVHRTHYSFYGMMMEKIMVLLLICPPINPALFFFLFSLMDLFVKMDGLALDLDSNGSEFSASALPYLRLIYSKY